MGFRFFRRISILPGVSVNLGKSGVSLSVGPRGMKTTIGKRGIKHSIGIPGTGVRWESPYRKFLKQGLSSGSSVGRAPTATYQEPRRAAEIHKVVYRNPDPVPSGVDDLARRCELAMQVDFALKCSVFVCLVLAIVGIAVLIYSGRCSLKSVAIGVGIVVAVSVARWIVRSCVSVSLDGVRPGRRDVLQMAQLVDAFSSAEIQEVGWTPAFDARDDFTSVAKFAVSVTYGTHFPFKHTMGFVTFGFASSDWLMTEWGALIIRGNRAVAMPYAGISVSSRRVQVLCRGAVPRDAQVIRTNWLHETSKGLPDKRYSYNPCNVLCNYGLVHITAGRNRGVNTGLLVSRTKSCALFPESTVGEVLVNNDKKGRVDRMEEYFESIYKASSDILSFISGLNRNRRILSSLNQISGLEALDNGRSLCRFNARLTMLVYNDLRKLYERLGHSTGRLDTYEGVGLMMLVSQLFKTDIKMDQFKDSDFCLQFASQMSSIVESSKQAFSVDDISVPLVFHYAMNRDEADRDVALQYAVLVYKWASLMAKVDGTISENERLCLEDVARLFNDRGAEFEVDECSVLREGTQSDDECCDPIEELNSLIGLNPVKEEVRKLASFISIQNQRSGQGLKVAPVSYHCVFTGSPGTGKTTVARILARVYKNLGVLTKGHLIETDRAGLVGEYVGQTAVKTNKIIDSALDGVLFIDEAYSLIGGGQNDYGREAIATLLKRMEDDRNRLVVILAGYTEDMREFIESNPGLRSRFSRYIEFPDYTKEELIAIFKGNLFKNEYVLDHEAEDELDAVVGAALDSRDRTFGNARYARNLFERVIENQAMRLSGAAPLTQLMLKTITGEDFVCR